MAKGAFVACSKHGTEVIKGSVRMLRARTPRTKKQRYLSGCPVCKKEAKAE